jgi:hypothetical protein
MAQRQIRRARDGSYRLRLSRPEQDLLRALPVELGRLLDEPENPDLRRLFPPAYDDAEAQHEYEHLVGADLLDGRRRALATIRETAGRSRLTPDEAESWLTGLNALRLVLGTRLDVRENRPPSMNPTDPNARDEAVYLYLSYLQEQLVEAISSGLHPNAR